MVGFERLLGTVYRILRRSAGFDIGLGRGTKTLHILLDQLAEKWPEHNPVGTFDPEELKTAQQIDVSSLRLPPRAGLIDADCLLPKG